METLMQVHIFHATGRIFGATPDSTGANLPTRYGAWTAFKTVELRRGETTPGVNADECLDDIETFGYHVTDAHVRITE
jgi:hypothetical protein